MTLTTTSVLPQTKQNQQQQKHQQQQENILLTRRGGDDYRRKFRNKKCPQHLFAYSIIPFLIFLCWQPDTIEALKDVSVTIPQAVKRGSNAMLTCNYDMENDTLYSVKWYKGRREFYRYTPKENPAMKVFPSQSGLNVERNLSNQSHVVLLAVPLNISGKFTCEISVEAPSFQTAMVSGEMEVVELPEEQATVTGIQPRYRIGDLVDGNCSIKYSKPAANLTWTINGVVVPPHHIKTYQIEKYEESSLESVMSAVHFMVTTQHFIRGQMRLKCTASIFDIFKEEIESVIEEDRPRIMASGQSYPPDHIYGTHGGSDGYEQNESYLTYFSAPKSSASATADFFVAKIIHDLKQTIFKPFHILMTLKGTCSFCCITGTIPINYLEIVNKVKPTSWDLLELPSLHFMPAALAVLFVVILSQVYQQKLLNNLTETKRRATNCFNKFRQVTGQKTENLLTINLWFKRQYKHGKWQQNTNENYYQDAIDVGHCQAKNGQLQQYQHKKHFSVANQSVVNVKACFNDAAVNSENKSSEINAIVVTIAAIDCQRNLSHAIALETLPPSSNALVHQPPSSSLRIALLRSSTATVILTPTPTTMSIASALLYSKSSLSLSGTLGQRKTYALDSFPFCAADAPKSNNANFTSKHQTLLMTFNVTSVANKFVVVGAFTSSNPLCKCSSACASAKTTTIVRVRALVSASEPFRTSVNFSSTAIEANSSPLPIFSNNDYLTAFIGKLLLRQC